MSIWWSAETGNLIGSLGGAAGGVAAGLLGMTAGLLAPRGKAKGLVLTLHGALLATGVAALCAGLIAVITSQPYHVWYPLVLIGGILTIVLGALFPVVFKRYREAEQRKLTAEEFRRAS